MSKVTAYFKDGQALTKRECEAHGINIKEREPLYSRSVLIEVCHEMATDMSKYMAGGVVVAFDYEKVVDKVLGETK